jgi:hypothetical protein
VPFEPDAALLLCSDGLTDLVDSSSINEIVWRSAGRPQEVVRSLIEAANAAGGKDNVTAVYVEGARFAPLPVADESPSETEITRRLRPADPPAPTRQKTVRFANIALIAVLIVLTFAGSDTVLPPQAAPDGAVPVVESGRIVVQASESIAQALQRATAGTTIVVEPGEYRETLTLKSFVRLVSSAPRRAVIRLPGAAQEGAAAVVANGITDAAIEGFRIVGDAATPLGTGVLAADSELSIWDVEIAGAADVAIDAGTGSSVRVVGADLHDNPGAAVAVRSGARAVVSHSVFARNGTAGRARKTLSLDDQGAAHFSANVFVGTAANVFQGSSEARAAFARDNWFVRPPDMPRPTPGSR